MAERETERERARAAEVMRERARYHDRQEKTAGAMTLSTLSRVPRSESGVGEGGGLNKYLNKRPMHLRVTHLVLCLQPLKLLLIADSLGILLLGALIDTTRAWTGGMHCETSSNWMNSPGEVGLC